VSVKPVTDHCEPLIDDTVDSATEPLPSVDVYVSHTVEFVALSLCVLCATSVLLHVFQIICML